MNEWVGRQRAICERFGVAFMPPDPALRLGIAFGTLGLAPLNGLRISADPGTCGWFLWAGEACSDHPDFYQTSCVEHLPAHCPSALPFLALPPGWRFLADGDDFDAWFDPALLEPSIDATHEE